MGCLCNIIMVDVAFRKLNSTACDITIQAVVSLIADSRKVLTGRRGCLR